MHLFLGLWDVLEALKWVNRNIGFFGGDRSRITIAGESAGSITVAYFSTSPLADGLFDQMIMESGSPTLPLPNAKPLNLAITELIALKVGCATDSQSFLEHHGSVTECLKRKKSYRGIQNLSFKFSGNVSGNFTLESMLST